MTTTTRRVFDAEFKRKAVELYINSDKTGQEVAGDLGISPEALYKWKRRYLASSDDCFPGTGHRQPGTPTEEEIRRLKAEISDLKMERDILKKAAAIFLEK